MRTRKVATEITAQLCSAYHAAWRDQVDEYGNLGSWHGQSGRIWVEEAIRGRGDWLEALSAALMARFVGSVQRAICKRLEKDGKLSGKYVRPDGTVQHMLWDRLEDPALINDALLYTHVRSQTYGNARLAIVKFIDRREALPKPKKEELIRLVGDWLGDAETDDPFFRGKRLSELNDAFDRAELDGDDEQGEDENDEDEDDEDEDDDED